MRRTTCSLVSIAVLLLAGSAAAQAPSLRYSFQAGRVYGYEVTIKIETDDYTETQTGWSLYRVTAAEAGRFVLQHEGDLTPKRTMKRPDVIDTGAVHLTPPPATLAIDPWGKVLSASQLTPLGHVLGYFETLSFDHLSATPQAQWKWEEEFEITESRFGHFIPRAGPTRAAKETLEYTLGELRGTQQTVNKTYRMQTTSGPGSAAQMAMSGSGWFVFDPKEGVVVAQAMNYRLATQDAGQPGSESASVECRLMPAARIEQILREKEERMKLATGAAAAAKPKVALTAEQRRQILAAVASPERGAQDAALDLLIQSTGDEERAEVTRAVIPLVISGDPFLQAKAARALVQWGTPEAIPALSKLAGEASDDGVVAAIEALAGIGTLEAAREIGAHADWKKEAAVAALQRMGPIGEEAALEMARGGDIFVQATACEVLAKVGGPRSVAALKALTASGDPHVRSAAEPAYQSVTERLGPAATAEALAAPPPAAASPVASSPEASPPVMAAPEAEMRTWSDASGRFRVEAALVEVADGQATLKKADGTLLEVPLDRLSAADHVFLSKRSAPARAEPRAPSADRPPAMVGGTGGWDFRDVNSRALVGIRYSLGSWGGEQTVGRIEAIFHRDTTGENTLVAKPGYAVGALNVQAGEYVNAIQIVFMRVKSASRLDPADSYTSDWIGYPGGKPARTVGGSGRAAFGLFGRHGAILNAVGLVFSPEENGRPGRRR